VAHPNKAMGGTGPEQPQENAGNAADSSDALQMALQIVAKLPADQREALLRALGATVVK